ncbi:T6SS effector amidase Tae4 family protein [Thiothrix winogradskyi]|uniref:Type VI secretion system amidase effector protein Tae4 n=1 Tax=Thiothrix winogradskyi TaxID=96472 RepID=A0ABY3T228_9GAMM|nr:T6SS effector amidase Tae4 family protein [Thiothrix winogradskyi]UJS25892.1 type VI secretion system amidase effector protein Tae4 [Thiothrix winogradskyi]
MPESSSFWSWLLSLFRPRRPAPVVPASPPPVTPPPSVTSPPIATEPERAAIVAELQDAPALPPPPPRRPPALTPLENTPPLPDIDVGILEQVLPQEGPKLGFRLLWNNHPTVETGETFPCRDAEGNPHFGNQCAILMGTCLLRSNLLQGYDKTTCWYRGHKGHTLRAREVADWMRRNPGRFGAVEIRRNVSWGAFKGRTGFVCFHNFWGEGNQGDHIDLWDGTGILMREKNPDWEGPALADGSLDYFERSEEVWFWPVH